MKKLYILSYQKYVQWRFWSDCRNAQVNLNFAGCTSKGKLFDIVNHLGCALHRNIFSCWLDFFFFFFKKKKKQQKKDRFFSYFTMKAYMLKIFIKIASLSTKSLWKTSLQKNIQVDVSWSSVISQRSVARVISACIPFTNCSRETGKRVIGKQCRTRSDVAECSI